MRIGMEGINGVSEQERYTRLHETDAAKRGDPIGKTDDAKEANNLNLPEAEYIPSEPVKGLYKPGRDAEGNQTIEYLDPHKEESPKTENAQTSSQTSRSGGSATTDTDKVDREIEKLKEKKAQLEQKLHTADESQKKELEVALRQVEAELAQKNNDSYRRQNTSIL